MLTRAAVLFCVLFSISSVADAAVSATSGAIVVSTPPADVSSNQWESNTTIRAVVERQFFVFSAPLAVDITLPGTSPDATSSNLSPGTVPTGTLVNSYLLHFDVIGTRATNNALEAIGSITFTDPILGLIVQPTALRDSNPILGLPNVTYASGNDHALELNPAGGGTSDLITLSPDRRTVTVDLLNASFADDARIVTAVPEPSMAPLVVFLIPLIFYRRVQRLCWKQSPN